MTQMSTDDNALPEPDESMDEPAPAAELEPQPTPAKGVRLRPRIRQEMALDLRIRGCSYREIGVAMDISGKSAFYLVKRARDRINKEVNEKAEMSREIELAGMYKMRAALWPRIEKGDTAAIQQNLTINTRISKLMGLEAPQQIEMKNALDTAVTDAAFSAMLAQFGDKGGAS